VFFLGRALQLSVMYPSSLFGPVVSYKEKSFVNAALRTM